MIASFHYAALLCYSAATAFLAAAFAAGMASAAHATQGVSDTEIVG